jgi:hypothetical protein
MENWTFGTFVEIVIWVLILGGVDTLIIRYVIKNPSRSTRKFIYVIDTVVTYFIFSGLASLFGYESVLLN